MTIMRIDEAEIEGNDPRCPLILLLDTSWSMGTVRTASDGTPLPPAIAELNRGLKTLKNCLDADSVARRRVDVQVVTFGGSASALDTWRLADAWIPPTLGASGGTPMGEAIELGVSLAWTHRKELGDAGIITYHPWIFLLTDGEPTDSVSAVPDLITSANSSKDRSRHFTFWSIAAQGANLRVLKNFTPERPVLRIDEADWPALFTWMSEALITTSRSQPTQQIVIDPWTITA